MYTGLAVLALMASPGCGFYLQAIDGHMDLMAARQPIDEVLADPDTSPELIARLELVSEARSFAVQDLALPDNDSYRSFVALDRPYVVWNVFAAPEFSVEPKRWCFPVAGCVVYRGYFSEGNARRYADRLAERGWDVHVGGATAYSTLGRFDDPVLSTMLRYDDAGLVAIIFHELAHQRLYVKGDSAFNEAFASTVEAIGVERWLGQRGDAAALEAYHERRQRQSAFAYIVQKTREELIAVYSRGDPDEAMRAGKRQAFADLRARYASLKDSWGGYAGFDPWFESSLNNASLVSVSTYSRLVPAFRELYRRSDGDMASFFSACEDLVALPAADRSMKLEALLAVSEGRAESVETGLR